MKSGRPGGEGVWGKENWRVSWSMKSLLVLEQKDVSKWRPAGMKSWSRRSKRRRLTRGLVN